MISALSRPRIHFGSITFSVCTFSRPSFFIVSAAHPIARERLSEPLSRLPYVSVSSASRCQAKSSAVAALIRRVAVSRYALIQPGVDCASMADAMTATTAAAESISGGMRFIEAQAYQKPAERPPPRSERGAWLSAGNRKLDTERASRGPGGLHAERSVVNFGDPLRDRQPEASALRPARRIELHEAFKNPRAIGFRNAGTLVGNPHVHARAIRRDIDRHEAA